MSDLNALQRRIAEFDELARDSEPFDDFASGLMMSGLAQMRDDFASALDVATRPEMALVLDGPPVKGHEIRIDALSRVLSSLQEAVSSIAQAVTGKATARASLPEALRNATSLSVAGTFAGSFGVMLRGPVDEAVEAALQAGQDPLVEHVTETALDLAVAVVLDVIDLAGDGTVDDGPIIEVVLPLGGRAFKHLKELSDVVVDRNLIATLTWRSLGREARQSTMDKGAARRLNDVLTANRVNETLNKIQGRLGTASEFRGGRIEILQPNGEVVSARVADELVPRLGEFYSHDVEADALVTTARSVATGIERSSYFVTGLSTVDDASPPPGDSGM